MLVISAHCKMLLQQRYQPTDFFLSKVSGLKFRVDFPFSIPNTGNETFFSRAWSLLTFLTVELCSVLFHIPDVCYQRMCTSVLGTI